MIFLTVGTEFQFDRLVKAVDNLIGQSLISEEVYAQIGDSHFKPQNMVSTKSLTRKNFEEKLCKSSSVISHAGIGTIISCLEMRKPLLVIPRLKKYGEIVNNHQLATARRYESMRYFLVAYDVQDLPLRLKELKSFQPPDQVNNSHMIINCIKRYLENVQRNKNKPNL